jgi:hypothetical protein
MGGGGRGVLADLFPKLEIPCSYSFVLLFPVDPGGSLVGYGGGFVGRGNIFFLVLYFHKAMESSS